MNQPKNQRKKAFTLIELIIVVVIIAILALVAIPKYYANVAKAQKSQVYANLDRIRQAALAYYAANGVYPAANIFPITVNVDGDTIVSMSNPDPAYTSWRYYFDSIEGAYCSTGTWGTFAYKQPGNSCFYLLCAHGQTAQTCTP